MPPSTPPSRALTTYARAERDGIVLCKEVLVVVHGKPGGLGTEARDDLTAWFYGAMVPQLECDLEAVADAGRGGLHEPEVDVDLVLQIPGGELRLDDCRVGLPVRSAGPPSTLEYRVSHPGTPSEQLPLLGGAVAAV